MQEENDSMEQVMDDLEEVFRYDSESRPQDRAHRYIESHRVMRGFNDTAMQVAASDMVRRAYDLGKADSAAPGLAVMDTEEAAGRLAVLSGELLKASAELRGMKVSTE